MMRLLIYKYEPLWEEVSVKSLKLRWPLGSVGLLVFFNLKILSTNIFMKLCYIYEINFRNFYYDKKHEDVICAKYNKIWLKIVKDSFKNPYIVAPFYHVCIRYIFPLQLKTRMKHSFKRDNSIKAEWQQNRYLLKKLFRKWNIWQLMTSKVDVRPTIASDLRSVYSTCIHLLHFEF